MLNHDVRKSLPGYIKLYVDVVTDKVGVNDPRMAAGELPEVLEARDIAIVIEVVIVGEILEIAIVVVITVAVEHAVVECDFFVAVHPRTGHTTWECRCCRQWIQTNVGQLDGYLVSA